MARPRTQPEFDISQVAGQYVVLCFIGSSTLPASAPILTALRSRTDIFDGVFASLFVIASGLDNGSFGAPADTAGFHFLRDPDGGIAQRYGVAGRDAAGMPTATATSFILDHRLRLIRSIPIRNAAEHAQYLVETVSVQPPKESRPYAPVLLVPRVFDLALCQELVELFQSSETVETGFMQNDPSTGRTIHVSDHATKRRRDWFIENSKLIGTVLERIDSCLAPEIYKAFQFKVTRVERCVVSCYDARDGGHFRIHRDNMSKATAHRRFAVTINLNTGTYDGGELVFPEFSTERWSPPIGGALVFSCSLLHEVRPVTRGQRYCFLPFLHDEAAEELRQRNMHMLENGIS